MLNTRLSLLESFLVLSEKGGAATKQQQKSIFPETKRGNLQKRDSERNRLTEEDTEIKAKIAKSDIWSFEPGSLTIVDLSCPFVDESAACAMFNICLAIFLVEGKDRGGCIVALDEAHKVRERSSLPRESNPLGSCKGG